MLPSSSAQKTSINIAFKKFAHIVQNISIYGCSDKRLVGMKIDVFHRYLVSRM
jgi:hypothetical protein